YSIVDGVLFRSLPFRNSDRIVAVWQTDPGQRTQAILASGWDRAPLDYTAFLVWRTKQTSFDGVGVWSGWGAMMQGAHGLEDVSGARISPGLFELLGVHAMLGRNFLPGEDVIGGPHVTVLSYETWRARFGARPDIVGTTVRFDDVPYGIIGVLPEGFTLQRGKPGAPFWVPAGQRVGDIGKHNRSFVALGRLKPGVSTEQATTETQQLLNFVDPGTEHGARIKPFVRDETRDVRAPLLILLGAVGLLLVIACANIATLLLGEATTRDIEMSARVALGATRGRIIRQLLTESVLLSMTGAALGALLAWWGTKAIIALAPPKIPGILTATVDGRVLGVALAAATITGLLFGLAPALMLAESGPAALLRGGQTVRGRGRLQRIMISAEIALSVVLLVGAGLLARSLQKLSVVDPGFRADHLLSVHVAMSDAARDSTHLRAFYADAAARLSAVPGVVRVTAGSSIPFAGGSSSSPYVLVGEGDAERKSRKHEVKQRTIATNYFETMGIGVIAGRAFKSEDRSDAPLVVIISEAAARRDFPNQSAIGQQVNYQGAWRTIVGLVRDVKYNRLAAADEPAIYTPFEQSSYEMDLIVRTSSDPAAMTQSVRTAVEQASAAVAVTNVELVSSLISRSFGEERFRTALIALFASIAAVLAAVGMYGVTARAVARRTREVGIRVALGATTRSVVSMIVNQTLAGVGIGILGGIVGALLASQVLVPYLFGTGVYDPVTYVAIVGLLGVVSVLASWLPARRAARVEPALVLRGE
ncbi:MAG TPA: ABC transporter permease, partial [Gemmatimonadaceae bacterium]|nr:ABC transporter permease [Gemmatimonadaceae bacterium]